MQLRTTSSSVLINDKKVNEVWSFKNGVWRWERCDFI